MSGVFWGGAAMHPAASAMTPRPLCASSFRVFKKRLATGRPIGNGGAYSEEGSEGPCSNG